MQQSNAPTDYHSEVVKVAIDDTQVQVELPISKTHKNSYVEVENKYSLKSTQESGLKEINKTRLHRGLLVNHEYKHPRSQDVPP